MRARAPLPSAVGVTLPLRYLQPRRFSGRSPAGSRISDGLSLNRINMVPPGLPVFLLLLLLPVVTGFQLDSGGDQLCAFTSSQKGAEPALANELRGVVQENGTIRCSRGSRCYGLWEKRADGELQLLDQGCWTHVGNEQECHGDRCVLLAASPAQVWKANYRFCCCARDLCNANFTEAPPTADTPALRLVKDRREDGRTGHQLTPEESALIALVTIAVATILIMGLFLVYRMKRKHKHALSAVGVLECGTTESPVDLDQLKLLELIGRGRYGAVFRGSLSERSVAVKLFSSANRQNFANECAVYFLPLLRSHDNIAHFLSADERTASDGRPNFLIVMEFYPHGCLSRYLSSHTVDWGTCCRMTHGVTRGLAFLHTELHRGEDYKPAVAHRDLTSRNVLVRTDLSCVLADFGLSMRLTETQTCCHGDDDTMTISEVGTVRYMSPEVLGGALNLRDCEGALKQVDVYALGLMLWEAFRRCSDLFPGSPVPRFQLAFQEELGNRPSLEDMRRLVVREKSRPRIPEAWRGDSLAVRWLKETMEDCWDQDAEARLTAQCAEERLRDLSLMATPPAAHDHRNLVLGRQPPQTGPASSFIEDFQVGVVRNLQGDAHPAAVIRTGRSGAEALEKNRKYEQGPQSGCALPPPPGAPTAPPPPPLCSTSQFQHIGGAVPAAPACLQLTEEDQEATKMEAAEVENSQEDLMEVSQERLTPEPQGSAQLLLQASDSLVPQQGAPARPLPKQQDLPQRPSSLHLLPRTNLRQVQTGVAQMDPVLAVEPHMVTMVTNTWRGGASSGVTGRWNPAGPQEDLTEGGPLLYFSPDEHEPLLRSDPPPGLQNRSGPPGRGSNSNNNNNRPPGGTGLGPGPTLDRLGPTGPTGSSSSSGTRTGDPPGLIQRPSSSPDPESSHPDSGGGSGTSDLLTPEPLQTLEEPIRAWRPERPRSLDLSLSCSGSQTQSQSQTQSELSTSGEKIRVRVKTPYTLKKWRPASWVVPTVQALDPDLDSSGPVRPGTKVSQSKSSMAVFLVGGGATETATSEPDGMTSF